MTHVLCVVERTSNCGEMLSWEDTLAFDLLTNVDMPEATIEVYRSGTRRSHRWTYVCINVETPVFLTRTNTRHTTEPNSFGKVMMATSSEIVLPSRLAPPEEKQLRKVQPLYNDLLGESATHTYGLKL